MIIFENIIGYDGIIFVAAAATFIIYKLAKHSAKVLYDCMHKQVYAPSYGKDIRSIREEVGGLTDGKVSALREKAISFYTLFVNLTGIFPLLGILGTVISLLGMVGETNGVTGHFFAALTSTFWGLVFAIIFKFLDGFVSPKLDDGERAAELFMQRNQQRERISSDISDISDIFEGSGSDSPETLPENVSASSDGDTRGVFDVLEKIGSGRKKVKVDFSDDDNGEEDST